MIPLAVSLFSLLSLIYEHIFDRTPTDSLITISPLPLTFIIVNSLFLAKSLLPFSLMLVFTICYQLRYSCVADINRKFNVRIIQPRSQGFSLEGGRGGKSPGNEVENNLAY